MQGPIPAIEFTDHERAASFIDGNLYYDDVTVITPEGKSVSGTMTSFDTETLEATLSTNEDEDGNADEVVVRVARIKVL